MIIKEILFGENVKNNGHKFYVTGAIKVSGLEIITFARVYVNLELSVNEDSVAYETMVKILVILNLLLKRVYLPQYFGNKSLLP